jgi:hypothetical protein
MFRAKELPPALFYELDDAIEAKELNWLVADTLFGSWDWY